MIFLWKESSHMSDYKIIFDNSILRTNFLTSSSAKSEPFRIYRVRKYHHLALFEGFVSPTIDGSSFAASKPVSREEFTRDAHYKTEEIFYDNGDSGTEAGMALTGGNIRLMVVSNPFFDSGEHRQKAHVAVHEPVQMAMDNIVFTLSKDSKHRPQML